MKSHKNGITTTIAAILNIIIHLALISKLGLYAASISTLCSYISLFIIRYIDIRKTIKLKLNNVNITMILILIYFCACQYANNNIINIINVCLSIIIFYTFNKDSVFKIFKKLGVVKK